MPTEDGVDREQIEHALAELSKLSVEEYGIELQPLLKDPAPIAALRLQRLAGIMLKRSFADPCPRTMPSETGARRAWPWKPGNPEASAALAPKELQLLNKLRMPGTWSEKDLTGTAEDEIPVSWDTFQDNAEHERGLFKVLALYIDDKLEGKDGRKLRDYLEAEESRKFEAGLDVTMVIFDAAVTGPLVALVGVPAIAVTVALIGLRYGYRRLTDPYDTLGDGQ